PVAGEYMHRDIFDIAEVYGKDTFMMIDKLGTDQMPRFFTLKGRMDANLNKLPLLPHNLTDRLMQGLSHLAPSHLPKRMKEYRERFEH
ncbi:D-lactate dehydrogenase, partial [Vibrio vulnificus]